MTKTLAIISNQAFSLINFRGALIQALVKSGVTVYALAPDFNKTTCEQVVLLGATPVDYALSRTGMNPFRDFRDTFALARLLKELNPDISFCYFIKPVIYGSIAAWLAKVPKRVALIAGLGYIFTESGQPNSLKKQALKCLASFLYRIALKRTHAVIFQNTDDLQEFVGTKIVEHGKCALISGTGVNLEEWTAALPVTNPITFTLAARLLREKGILEFVEAARLIKKGHPEVEFTLLGDVDANPGSFSTSQVNKWVEEGLIEWPGHVPVKPWLEKTSVYVLPSYREGVPRSTQEAMAMGRAVITTDAPGCRETVIDGENGFLIPVRNAEALAEKMRLFIEDPLLITNMGQKSRALAEERFDVHKINKKLIKIIAINSKDLDDV